MRNRLYAIWSILLVLIVSIAVVVPGCDGGACTGDIEVKATLCDAPWTGAVQYKLTGPGATAPTIINGNSVNATHSGVDCGNWTCEHVSGGPPGAYLVDITPDPTQEVTSGDTITFTLNFEEEQDAWIDSVGETWTINGIPIEEYGEAYYEDGYWYAWVTWCDVIDVHYQQGVDGCEGRQVTLNETDELEIHYYWPVEGASVMVEVYNDWCAVNKTVEPEGPEGEKLGQVPSFMGEDVNKGATYFIPWCSDMTLDVETSWQLEKCLNYTKSINWLHIGECFDPPCDWCVLFNLNIGEPGTNYELRSRASVALVDDVDADPENNSTDWSTPLRIITW